MMNHSTTQLFFDDMPVPCENLIGEEGKGFRYILTGMNAERMLIAAECIGMLNGLSSRPAIMAVSGRYLAGQLPEIREFSSPLPGPIQPCALLN